MDNTSTRASDDDRDAVIRQLSAQTAAGRLTQAEFERRMETALRSRTWGELSTLVADLPVATTAPATRRPRFHTDRCGLPCLLLVAAGLAATAVGSPVAAAALIAAVALCALSGVRLGRTGQQAKR